jgi:hypothetical protein
MVTAQFSSPFHAAPALLCPLTETQGQCLEKVLFAHYSVRRNRFFAHPDRYD